MEPRRRIQQMQGYLRLVNWYIGDQGKDELEAYKLARKDLELSAWGDLGQEHALRGWDKLTLPELIAKYNQLYEHPGPDEYECYAHGWDQIDRLGSDEKIEHLMSANERMRRSLR